MAKQKKPPMPTEKIVELYGGDVKISYDDNAHSYVKAMRFADGSYTDWYPTHGITTPLSALTPKPFLKPWAAKESTHATLRFMVEKPHMLDEVKQLLEDLENGMDKSDRWAFTKRYSKWLTPLKKACDLGSTAGKDTGTWLHAAIETYYNSERKVLPLVTEELKPMWDGFLKFDNLYQPKITPEEGTEFFVYSKLFGYSGQGDFIGEMNGRTVIGDWKSTNRSDQNPHGISIDYFYQVGGLAQAKFEETGQWVDDLVIVNIDKKGADPSIIFSSEFGVSVQECAKAYIAFHNTYHLHQNFEYKFLKRDTN